MFISSILRSTLAFLITMPQRISQIGREDEIYPDVVVFDESVYEDISRAIGKYDELKNKQVKCKMCSGIITQDSLRVIMPNNGTYDFICDEPLCYHNYLSKGA